MKKILFLTLVLTLGISSIANNRVLTDYVDNDKIFDILKNDTITIQYYGSENQFKFIEPDTIWKKRVKRPKENKHYTLQWYQSIDQTNGISVNTQNKISKQFIFQDFVHHINGGKIELSLYDLELNREIVFIPNKTIEITSNSVEDDIVFILKDSVIYYKPSKYLLLEEEDVFYEKTSLKDVHYQIKISPYANNYPISIVCTLKFNNDINGYLNNNGLNLIGSIDTITKDEFIVHNAKVQKNLKQDSIVRLATVFDHEAIYSDSKYGFEGDTMAIVQYFRKCPNKWSDSLDYFIAYAYGKEYTITIESYENIQDKVIFIDTTDLEFLKTRGSNGLLRRKETAKIWDAKNSYTIQNDLLLDTTHVVMGTYIYDWTIQNIDMDGEILSKYETPPTDGTLIPIFKYGSGGDISCAWWGSYNGKIFAIDWRGIKFENEEDRLFLMRRGDDNVDDRYVKALARDFVDRLTEALEEEEKKQQEIDKLKKRKIFLLSMDKAYGDYDWCGIKPKFLNCYNKTIKYIDCLVVPYNRFDDVQSDDYGRSSKEIRCIGPFEPGEIASWRFDDMFKNESGIIKTFRITNIKITFIDNSTILYKGWENVKKHYEYVYEL